MSAVRGGAIVIASMIVSTMAVMAGSLDSPAGPNQAASAMPTLEDLYDRLVSGAEYVLRTSFVEPAAGPGVTGRTLQQVMDVTPEADNSVGAATSEVLAGKTFWGLRTDGGGWGLQTGTGQMTGGPAAPVGETGQVTCWGEGGVYPIPCPGTGEDGDLRPGVPWPNPRFTDHGDGTVTDNLTGLIWLKDASCNGTMAWAAALTWANGLYDGCPSCGGADNDCGLADGSVAGDWRLPSRNELQSLIAYEYYQPALSNAAGTAKWSEGNAFFGVQLSSLYWTSTSVPAWSTMAWNTYISYGHAQISAKSGSWDVWPVRGGE